MKVPVVGPTISGNLHDIKVDYIVRVGMFEDMGSEIHLDLPVIIGTIGKIGKVLGFVVFEIHNISVNNVCGGEY